LTGIFNRQHFIEASGHSLDYCAKSLRDACVVVIDLDHFKDVNDTHGHAAGDLALKRAVAACQGQLRSVDVFGRLGGEEFGIFMPDCVPERAADQAELIRQSIAGLCKQDDDPIGFPVSASFGVSAAHWSGYDLPRMLAHADSALYKAKREGRNRVAVYGESSPRELRDRRHH
jgi:diguanylate cyclase (GGDEF)-like protein